MAFSAADLRMVDDHIAQGERHVTRQEEIVAWLREHGHPTEVAEQLLAEFRSTLVQHRAHRELMLHDSEPDPLGFSSRAPAGRRGSRPPKRD